MIRLGLLVFAAVTFVVIGDVAGSLLTRAGVSPLLVAWARFALAAAVLFPLLGLRWPERRAFADWRVLLRGALIAGGIACILTGLRTAPIADVFGAFFIGPVVSYLLAVLFLGERPRAAQTLLLSLGFVGVMLVVKPGFGAGPGMGFALAAGCFYGAFLAMTRVVAGAYRPRLLLFSQLAVGTVLLAPLGLNAAGNAPSLDLPLAGLFVLSAFGSAAGNYLLVVASKRAEASLIAPLIYTQLISAVVLGFAVFGDVPDALAVVGMCLILVSGLGALGLRGAPAAAHKQR
ncbi:MAG: DMT family transporter [Pseudomonadota bacterium]